MDKHPEFERCTNDIVPLVKHISPTHKRCPAAKLDMGHDQYSCIDRQCRRLIRIDQDFCHMHRRCKNRRDYVGPRTDAFDFTTIANLHDPSSQAQIVDHYMKRTSTLLLTDLVAYLKTLPGDDDAVVDRLEQQYTQTRDHSLSVLSDMMLRCIVGR